jgi:hypothetical protein
MLIFQINCEDAIQIVINPIIESIPYFNKYSQSKAERTYEKVCRKIDALFPESHLFDFSHTANQLQHQNYQER